MRLMNFRVWIAVLAGGAFTGGCAAAPLATCTPADSTMSCCIKAHPLSPVDSCGASEAEAVAALTVLKTAYEASRLTEDDFANNAQLPEWQQACIRSYVDCKNQGWKGRCYDCLRYCEGQHEWPFKACAPTRK
ncbi:hypothetical protein [Corallococcus exercitus]|nr:hypothetical protein [Corallococcus exercitus]